MSEKKDVSDKSVDLDYFIDPSVNIENGSIIKPQEKLLDFARIKLSAIDPDVRNKLKKSVKNIRKNLDLLK